MTENLALDKIAEDDLLALIAYGNAIVNNNTAELNEVMRKVVDQKYNGVYSCPRTALNPWLKNTFKFDIEWVS